MIQLRPLVGTNALVNFVRQYYDAGPGVFQYFSGQVGAGGVPSMYEDFTTGQALDPRITFSRTSNATLTGSNGLIQYAPHNLLTYSEQFDNAAWTKGGVTITANATASPDGTTTADRYVESALNEVHSISSISVTAASGATYTLSVYAKNAGRFLRLILPAGTFGVAVSANFDLVNGIAYDTAGSGAVIQSVGNGWYRCSIRVTATTGAAGTISVSSAATSSGTGSYTGDGISGIYLWGAQLEIGSTATTYNPTTVKNLLGYTQEFDNAAWTKSNSFVQTNLLTYSEQVDNAAWTKNNVTPTANTTTAPDGSLTADLVDEGSASAQHYFFPAAIAATTGTTYTASVYMKQGTVQWMQIPLNSVVFGVNAWANFDLVNGVVGNVGASATATITPAGNGWFRCAITSTATASSTGTTLQIAFCGNTDTATRLPTTTGANLTVNVWGAQLVQGSSAGDYTATYSAAKAVMYPAPDGSVSADKLVENTVTAGHYVLGASVSLISGTPYTGFVYAKAAERTQVAVTLSNAFTSPTRSVFDLSSGTVVSSTASVTSATITPVGNGWYLCGISSVCVGVAAGQLIVQPASSGNISYTGDGTSGIYIWGAQLSDSASVDPYVYNPVAAPSAAAYYGPRFDYDPITLAPKGLLIEEQRTNLLTYSEQFDNAVWTKTRSSITSNVIAAPDGTVTGDKLVEDTTATNSHTLRQTLTIAAVPHTFTVYAKAAERSWVRIVDASITNGGAYFNLGAGTLGTIGANATASIISVGNGWYRCSITVTTTSTGDSFDIRLANADGGDFYTGDGVSGLYLWGAQLEAGAFATSYIPTVASQVTRSADTAIMQGANFSNWYNQNNGTFYAEVRPISPPPAVKNARFLETNDGTATSRNPLMYGSIGGTSAVQYRVSGVDQANLSSGGVVFIANTLLKVASAYQTNDFAASFNGAAVITDTSGAVAVGMTELDIGYARSATTEPLNGWVSRIAYYNRRLANSELQGITA